MTEAESTARGASPEVGTSVGRLRGAWEGGVAVFRGVPYAEPPIGGLRFAAPQPSSGWDGVREAFSFGPPPPQGGHFGMDTLSREADGGDWLTINVWSPTLDAGARLPVMVWIQGGAYVIGTSGLPEYDGGRLAREGGVVVVTFNYRVGVEGFAHIEGAPANRGLLDQVAALEWVRDNISSFGGDPDRVAVFGQSAGGGSVAALLAMPKATGLFHMAIAQSLPGTFFSPGLASDIAAACAAELGLRPTLADLSGIDPRRLVAAADAVGATMGQQAHRWGRPAWRGIPFSPVVDGEVVAVTPWQALAQGAGHDIGLLVGHTRDEQRLFTALDGLLGGVSEEQAQDALREFSPVADGGLGYRDAFPAASLEELYELVHSDWLFRMPSLHLADAQITGGGRAHVYELTWPAPGMGGILGACHGLDVPLVFGNLDRGQTSALIGEAPSPAARSVSDSMIAAWASFAADGDPGWPAYDKEHRLVQVFDERPAVRPYPEEASRLLWQDYAFPSLPLDGR